jgi:hypothetical protein
MRAAIIATTLPSVAAVCTAIAADQRPHAAASGTSTGASAAMIFASTVITGTSGTITTRVALSTSTSGGISGTSACSAAASTVPSAVPSWPMIGTSAAIDG